MARNRESLAVAQFGAHARAYVTSAVHAGGAELERIAARAALEASKGHLRALDLGTGGGHVAYALAQAAGAVTAVDPSSDMLAAVAAEAERRCHRNIETVRAGAEDLPFRDGGFDFLASRFSAHHWRDAAAGLREARRVARAGATAFFIDIVAPETPAFDTHLQAVELLRDVSHVRDYSVAQWRELLAQAGFSAPAPFVWRLRMDFSEWTRRIGTPAPLAEAIRLLQRMTDDATRAHFGIEADGSFWLDAAMFEATAV